MCGRTKMTNYLNYSQVDEILVKLSNIEVFIQLIILVIIALIIYQIVKYLLIKFQEKTNIEDKNISGITKIIRIITAIIIVLGCLDIFGIDLSSIFVSLGLLTLSISLATKNIISNFIAGVSIQVEKTFKVDDLIEINNSKGTVKKIGIKNVELLSRDETITVPNILFTNNAYINYTAEGYYMQRVNFSIPNDKYAQQNIKTIHEILDKSTLILKDHNYSLFVETFNNDEVEIILNLPLSTEDLTKRRDITSQILMEIHSKIQREVLNS